MEFSLFFFAASDAEYRDDKYRLVVEGAKFADEHGFAAVWTPERHFHEFGGPYPNPSVMSAALAMVTKRIHLRGGSVVAPLHHAVRIAEEWALVDNLSRGRVGIAFASGWQPNDFVLYPERYASRRESMMESLEIVRRLWRGETIRARGGGGNEVDVRVYPAPFQKELPIWLTSAGNVETFQKAGEIGASVLTHLLGQTFDELAVKIAAYRAARAQSGHCPESGHVTLMLHTFIGEDIDQVREVVRGPFSAYLRSSVDLWKKLFEAIGMEVPKDVTPKDVDDVIVLAFERYFHTAGLFGTPSSCLPILRKLSKIGVDEIGCLVDFGVAHDAVLESLPHLDALRKRRSEDLLAERYSMAALAREHRVSLFQCTPSQVSMLMTEPGALEAFGSLRALLLGGEALPSELAAKLREAIPARIHNMYGPTETTIWSSTHQVDEEAVGVEGSVALGRPIANTDMYVLDSHMELVPVAVPGEVYIGGDGVARGYLNRPDLTAERFVTHPFKPDAVLYRTGDLGRYRPDGVIEFLGRVDDQVKIRGFRIELAEIEAVLRRQPGVRDAAVAARGDGTAKTLVAYWVKDAASAVPAEVEDDWVVRHAQEKSRALARDPALGAWGWLRSHTGEPARDDDVRSYVESLERTIRDLRKGRVLEIGCDSGLLAGRLARECDRYFGTDVSERALAIAAAGSGEGNRDVTFARAAAIDTLGGEREAFDLVILHAAAQHFPTVDYVRRALARAVAATADGGAVVVSDVLVRPLLAPSHASIELRRAPPLLAREKLSQRVRSLVTDEEELALDPEVFDLVAREMPRVVAVRIELSRGPAHCERSRFRCNVVVHVGGADRQPDPSHPVLDWRVEKLDLASFEQQVSGHERITLADVPNARVGECLRLVALLDDSTLSTEWEVRKALWESGGDEVDPEEIASLAEGLGYEVDLAWPATHAPGRFDLVLRRRGLVRDVRPRDTRAPRRLADYGNDPVAAQLSSVYRGRLRTAVKDALPEYMVPAHVIEVAAMPMTPNGKLDRKALPAPDGARAAAAHAFVAPRTVTEQVVARAWGEVLGAARVGVYDDFFELGGDSLRAVQLVAKLRETFRGNVSLAELFSQPTVEKLASTIDAAQAAGSMLQAFGAISHRNE